MIDVDWVELIRYPARRPAEELQFVLRGGGVPSSLVRVGANGSGPYHAVLVPADRLDEARAILEEEGLGAARPAAAAAAEALTPPPGAPGLHWVVGLIVINLLVWIAMEGSGGSERHDLLLRFGASHAPHLREGQWWRTVSAVFIHIGLRHLLANMITLALLGPPVLRAWRVGRFTFMYLAAGLAGNWLSFALSPTIAVKAGASGAILGLLGVLAGTRIRAIRAPESSPGASRFKVWHIIAMLVAFYGFVIGVGGTVDHLAHIGGLLAGCLLALVLPPPGRPRRGERALEWALGGVSLLLVTGAGLAAYLAGAG